MRHDAIVVGGGPGGYVAAIRMGQLGLKVGLVEEGALGGVCLNWGCVPTKALYSATRLVAQASRAAGAGIEFGAPAIDLLRLAAWKEGIVSRLAGGIVSLLKQNGVTLFPARGTLAGPGRVVLATGETLESERVVLATGSSPVEIPGFPFSHSRVWSSDDALALREVPARLLVVGAGVVGLELATIYRRLGSEVAVVEMMGDVLPGLDLDARTLALVRRAQGTLGIALHLNAAAESFEETSSGLAVRLRSGERLEAERVLVAVGRRPNSSGIGLETAGISPDRRGFVPVDLCLKTTAPGVWAIGDLVPGPMLAHKASAEGVRVAGSFAGEDVPLDYEAIPQAVFTDPEVASVGLSEARAKEKGHETVVGRFPYAALGKALGMGETEGFFQVVGEKGTGRLLGVQIVGAEASDLISEAALAVQSRLTLSQIADAVHPHPTLPEGLKEAAENALGRAIHTVNR
jgi:dihydrolipoamide dehydrogenase